MEHYTLYIVTDTGRFEFSTLDLAPTITMARLMLESGAAISARITSTQHRGMLIEVKMDR
jgi:nanoRNase/pAp phosphatase (c-di-AMP/oligoRNAs hydrolase)